MLITVMKMQVVQTQMDRIFVNVILDIVEMEQCVVMWMNVYLILITVIQMRPVQMQIDDLLVLAILDIVEMVQHVQI